MATLKADDRGVIVTCPSCGRKTRIPYGGLDRTGRCGHCKEPVPAPGAPVEVDREERFYTLVRTSPIPVVVDFWAPWCGPCRMMAPELERVAREERGRFIVAKVNTDELPGLGQRYGIRSIPTMAVFAGGEEVSRAVGARRAPEIRAFVHAEVGG